MHLPERAETGEKPLALGRRHRPPQRGRMRAQPVHDAPPVAAVGLELAHRATDPVQEVPGPDAPGRGDQFGDHRQSGRPAAAAWRRWACGKRPFRETSVIGARRGCWLSESTASTAVSPLPSTTAGSSGPTTLVANGRHGSGMNRVRGPLHRMPDRVRRRAMAHGQDDGIGMATRPPAPGAPSSRPPGVGRRAGPRRRPRRASPESPASSAVLSSDSRTYSPYHWRGR